MKNLFLLLLTITLFSCEKDEPPITPAPTKGKVTFFRSVGGSWNLIIDGADKGELAELDVPPPCEYPGFITLELSIGTHTYDLKSNDGLAWGNPTEFEVAAGCQVVKAVY